jgi:hypothetical protein
MHTAVSESDLDHLGKWLQAADDVFSQPIQQE